LKTYKQFLNEGETMRDLFYNPPWQPLYNFLKPIFGDSYMEAANQWMFMEKAYYLPEDYCGSLYFYKNGITRKYLVLDKNGVPYNVKKRKDTTGDWDTWQDRDLSTVLIANQIPVGQAFKEVYDNIENFTKFAIGEEPKSPYLVGYNDDFKCNLYSKLKELGYKVIGIDDTDTWSDVSQKLKDSGIGGCKNDNDD